MTDGRSVSQYVLVASPLWACDQTLFPVWRFMSESCFLVSVGCPLWREVGFASCQSLSAVFNHFCQNVILFTFYMSHVLCLYNIYTRPLSTQAQYRRSCPIICSLHYNSSLNTWTVVSLTAAKFKPLIFPVSGFALSYIADICIFMILYDFCLLPV
jgi:hypothetical protein